MKNATSFQKGEHHFKAKLTNAQALDILSLRHDHGWVYDRIAKTYKMSITGIHYICIGKNYKDAYSKYWADRWGE
jgi:hypothetical protein